MLILTGSIGEIIYVGDDIKVVLIDCKGSKIKLGFDAPKTIPVNRQKIHERIKKEKLASIPAETKKT